jgi:uncharacterized repeat protein (TIGR01451 family)
MLRSTTQSRWPIRDQRRKYDQTASSAATVITPTPAITKTVSVSTATIGAPVAYTIRVPSTPINVSVYKLRVLDALPAGLTVTGISHNGADIVPGVCGSINVINNISGNSIDLTYDCLPPNAQMVISATGTVRDIAGNQEGVVLSNISTFTWASSALDDLKSPAQSPAVTTTLKEPVLTIDKTLLYVTTASVTQGLQAGDHVKYHIKILAGVGANAVPAYDLVIRDIADENLISPAVTAGPDNPGRGCRRRNFGRRYYVTLGSCRPAAARGDVRVQRRVHAGFRRAAAAGAC